MIRIPTVREQVLDAIPADLHRLFLEFSVALFRYTSAADLALRKQNRFKGRIPTASPDYIDAAADLDRANRRAASLLADVQRLDRACQQAEKELLCAAPLSIAESPSASLRVA